jgi:Putative adhesin
MAATTVPFLMTRARRVALVIGVPVCLLLVGWTGFSTVTSFAEGKYPVSYRAPAGTNALTLNVTGQLTIKPATAGRATLSGTAHFGVVRPALAEHSSAGATTLGYRCPFPVGDCELDATLTVPATVTTLTAHSGGGNATVTGTTGPVNLSTGEGNLSVAHASGPLTLNTDSGSIEVSATGSATSPVNLLLSSGAGNIQATGVNSTTITANTDSGNISGSGISTSTITASTGDGKIVITFSSVPENVRVNTDSGSITLELPAGSTRYDIDAHTDSGSVTAPPSDPSSSHVITATSGSGSIFITEQ